MSETGELEISNKYVSLNSVYWAQFSVELWCSLDKMNFKLIVTNCVPVFLHSSSIQNSSSLKILENVYQNWFCEKGPVILVITLSSHNWGLTKTKTEFPQNRTHLHNNLYNIQLYVRCGKFVLFESSKVNLNEIFYLNVNPKYDTILKHIIFENT